ncbi:3'-5' exonuclease domain-containing protein 2 [Methylomonas sp. SURF-1]|uniref:3'-5' exonuclease n=1 Tax=Methylomonas aurea TaxID=2952224 RepID=A0ABT1UI02_9GAMM|nr:3'-5' exonuclease [Methylomonas sp. SURF-1]MCQ8181867.1 3'-5' exonuclease domain-containing protein 2 [Methylomonas sp. SURF-1]
MLKSLAHPQRIKLIKNICGEAAEDELNSIFEKAMSFLTVDCSFLRVIELFYLIDNLDNIDFEKLERYSIGQRKIKIVKNNNDLNSAIQKIGKNRIIGFDTEKKPSFKKGAPPNQISIIQIANDSDCYIFQVKSLKDVSPLLKVLEDINTIKIGSGLSEDIENMLKEFGVRPRSFLDLHQIFKTYLYSENDIGAKKAVAIFLGKNMKKSKKMSRSNWENKDLSENQIIYAAEDASAVYDVFKYLINNYPFIINTLPKWFHEKAKIQSCITDLNKGIL